MATVPSGADLRTFVANHQGETINVPAETYSATNIPVGSGTTLIFNGTTIDPGTGPQHVFECSGSGWHVGGNVDILQQKKNLVLLDLRGSGQFGDDTGRINVVGHADLGSIPGASDFSNRSLFNLGSSGDIEIVNLTHPGSPPGSENHYRLCWSDRSGDLTLRGCDLRNTGSNGFYIKPMSGRFEAHNCYFKNINVAAVRTGCDWGTLLSNCNFVYDDGLPSAPSSSVSTGGRFGSGVALQSINTTVGPIEIQNCDYVQRSGAPATFIRDMVDNDGAPRPTGGYQVHISGTQWTGYPNNIAQHPAIDYHLEGGNGGNPTDHTGPPNATTTPTPDPNPMNEIVNIDGTNEIVFTKSGNNWDNYMFTVEDGTIEKTDPDLTNDRVEGNTAYGNIGGSYEALWRYTGKLVDITRESGSNIEVRVNGTPVTSRINELLAYYDSNYVTDPPSDGSDPTDPTDPSEPTDAMDWALPLLVYALIRNR